MRAVMSVDARGYSKVDTRGQFSIQRRLLGVLDDAAKRAGLHRGDWLRQEAGDGELAVLPETEPEQVVVDEYVRELHVALMDLNHDLADHARLRLRLAIHYGVTAAADNGFAGPAAVVAGRLVDSQPVRRCLEMLLDAQLVVVMSTRVFEDTVAQRLTSLSARDFRRVRLHNKEFDEEAWLRVPGFDVHAADLSTSAVVAPEARPDASGDGEHGADTSRDATATAVTNVEHSHIEAHGPITFGISYGQP